MWREMIQALERPATTARATKSCSLTASVSPRIWRVKRGHSKRAMTRTTLRKLGSETATMTTAMAGDQAEGGAEGAGHADGDEGHEQRNPATVDDPTQHVAPEPIGSQRMIPAAPFH